MKTAIFNVCFIAIAFLLCECIANARPFALLRVAVEKVSKGLKRNSHSKASVTI